MVKQGETINGRITVRNGKFRVTRGERDATFRYGKNIPYDLPDGFSAGYTGGAILKESANYLKNKGK